MSRRGNPQAERRVLALLQRLGSEATRLAVETCLGMSANGVDRAAHALLKDGAIRMPSAEASKLSYREVQVLKPMSEAALRQILGEDDPALEVGGGQVVVRKRRVCRLCGYEFSSAWAGERVCKPCKAGQVWLEGEGLL